jgi:molybdopterin-guanine dinucleotide biosynthesis protein A
MIVNISGVILAGGDSKRFNGITKSNIVIGGKTIISRITDTISEIFDEIIIVTNTPEDFKDIGNCRLVNDKFVKAGPLGGIHAALMESSKNALFVFAGDMPFPDRKLILQQIKKFNTRKCDILVPGNKKFIEPLHAIYRKSILKPLEDYLEANQNFAVREFLKSVGVNYFEFEDRELAKKAFTNINSIQDILSAEEILRCNPEMNFPMG